MTSSILVEYNAIALVVREQLNITHVVLFPLCVFLVVRTVRKEWQLAQLVYGSLARPVKGLVGLGVFFASDWVRAATIWFILHTLGVHANYLTDVIPLVASLAAGTTGLLCFIRNFTPKTDECGNELWWGGHRLWLIGLAACVLVSVVNWSL